MAGANIIYHNKARLSSIFLRKLGLKAQEIRGATPFKRNNAADVGTTTPRQIAFCAKYHLTVAPASNTAADAPNGKGDICVYFAANSGSGRVAEASISIYRCSAFTSSSTFTWTQIV